MGRALKVLRSGSNPGNSDLVAVGYHPGGRDESCRGDEFQGAVKVEKSTFLFPVIPEGKEQMLSASGRPVSVLTLHTHTALSPSRGCRGSSEAWRGLSSLGASRGLSGGAGEPVLESEAKGKHLQY